VVDCPEKMLFTEKKTQNWSKNDDFDTNMHLDEFFEKSSF
jgi:hypothetical protein